MGGESWGMVLPTVAVAAVNVEREEHWKHFDNSVNVVSFGFVATAILISMFLVMAIFWEVFYGLDNRPLVLGLMGILRFRWCSMASFVTLIPKWRFTLERYQCWCPENKSLLTLHTQLRHHVLRSALLHLPLHLQ